MKEGQTIGSKVAKEAFNIVTGDASVRALSEKYKQAHYSKDDVDLRMLDLSMKGETDRLQNEIAT